MNKQLFNAEMHRTLWNKRSLLSILMGLIFIGYQVFVTADSIEKSAFSYLIEYENSTFPITMYILTFPLLATFIGSSIYVEDKRKGYLPMILTRVGTRKYYGTTAVVSFLVGGIVVILPLIMQALFAFMKAPAFYYPYPYQPIIHEGAIYGGLFYESPVLHWLFSTFQFFIFGGTAAVFGYAISLRAKIQYVEYIIPFLGVFVLWIVAGMTGYFQISPVQMLLLKADDVNAYGNPQYMEIIELAIVWVYSGFKVWKCSHDENL